MPRLSQARDRAEAKALQQADELSKIGSHLAVIRESSDSQHGMLTDRLQVHPPPPPRHSTNPQPHPAPPVTPHRICFAPPLPPLRNSGLRSIPAPPSPDGAQPHHFPPPRLRSVSAPPPPHTTDTLRFQIVLKDLNGTIH